jgi:hypothetical protein
MNDERVVSRCIRSRPPTGVDVDQEQLAAAADALDRGAGEAVQRRVEGLHRVDPRGERRLDLGAGDGGGNEPRGDLDLGQLRHC